MNSMFRNFRGAGLWIALLLITLARVGLAADLPPKLQADLIYLGDYPLHVVMEYEQDLLGDSRYRVKKAKLRPQVKCPSAVLREAVFDVSSEMTHQGLKMPAGSHALFSPSAQLFYIESTHEDVDLVKSFFYGNYGNTLFSVDLSVALVSPEKTEILQEVKAMPFVWGERIELSSVGEGRCHLILDPILGPDGDTIDIDMEANIDVDGKSLKSAFKKTISRSKHEDIELGTLGDAIVTVRMLTHLDQDYFGPPVLETDAKKAAAIAEIQKALRSLAMPSVSAIPEGPGAPFVRDVLHVATAIHITPDAHISHLDQGPKPAYLKAAVSPEVPSAPKAFGEKAYDVTVPLREIGLTLPRGSRALYGPGAKLLYIESTPDDVMIADAVFHNEPSSAEDTADVKVVSKSADREETLLEVESAALIEGRDVKFSATGRETFHLMIQPLDHWGGGSLHIGVGVQVQAGDRSITARSTWLTHHSKPLETVLGRFGDDTVMLSIQTHSREGRWGDDPESEKENKSAAIKEIQEALNKAK